MLPPMCMPQSNDEHIQSILSVLNKAGFVNLRKIANTLQGAIWQGTLIGGSNDTMIIKVTNKYLHSHSISIHTNHKTYRIDENILIEQAILEYLNKQHDFPISIVRYHQFFESNHHYYLVEQSGGRPLFNFVLKAHKLILNGNLAICEWHQFTKLIFKQMVDCIGYIHSKNVCHFDVSLENFLISDVLILETPGNAKNTKTQIRFLLNGVQCKICDFGLAEYYDNATYLSNKWCGKQNYQSPEINAKKKDFNAKSNDVFCLGVCLWMLTIGVSPWKRADPSDASFMYIINGHITDILQSWRKEQYVDEQWMDLMQQIFQFENKRIDL
eukprot:102698_1